jgi:HTH-type transcriptional regulator / antitoxin HipB
MDTAKSENETMKDDLDKYVSRRKRTDKKFAENFESGYQEFKVGVLLRQAREQAGITQEDLAQRTKTKKSAISRLENHAEDVRLSSNVSRTPWAKASSSNW